MRLVVADAGPLNYLVLIDAIDLLPQLFEKIFVPVEVRNELNANDAPAIVRAWIVNSPPWLDVKETVETDDDRLGVWNLDIGERSALALAHALKADLILMDDRAAVAVARRQGFAVTGTLGVLDLAARRGLIDLAMAFARLKTTNFRYRPEIMDELLQAHNKKRNDR